MLPGHLAVPTILRHYIPELAAAPLFASSIFPDVVDKSLKEAGLAPSGRYIAHTWLVLVLTTVVVARLRGTTAAQSWALGYLGHLAGDTAGDVPLLYPFKPYAFRSSGGTFWQKLQRGMREMSMMEVGLIGWALLLVGRRWLQQRSR